MDAETLISMQAQDIALLKGAISAQDEREQKAGERCGVPYEQHGCDWPDWMAEKVLSQSARIAQLEALGPLIEEYGQAKWSQGYDNPTSEKGSSDAWVADLWGRINATLKGGA